MAKEIKLSEEQQQIVQSPLEHSFILAGPGSGKTEVLAQRIKYIINNYKVKASEILIFSYTKNAAQEIRNRIIRSIGKQVKVKNIHASTLHSFALREVSNYINNGDQINIVESNTIEGLEHDFIYKFFDGKFDEIIYSLLEDEIETIKNSSMSIFDEFGENEYHNSIIDKVKDRLLEILSEHTERNAKNKNYTTISEKCKDIYKKAHNANTEAKRRAFARMERDYELLEKIFLSYLIINNNYTFDAIIYLYNDILKHSDNISYQNEFSKNYKVVIVDEVQDLGGLEFTTITSMVNHVDASMLCGDVAQSIYKLDTVKHINKYLEDYEVSHYHLSQSYRLPEDICNFTNLIRNDNKVKIKPISKNGRIFEFYNPHVKYWYKSLSEQSIMKEYMNNISKLIIALGYNDNNTCVMFPYNLHIKLFNSVHWKNKKSYKPVVKYTDELNNIQSQITIALISLYYLHIIETESNKIDKYKTVITKAFQENDVLYVSLKRYLTKYALNAIINILSIRSSKYISINYSGLESVLYGIIIDNNGILNSNNIHRSIYQSIDSNDISILDHLSGLIQRLQILIDNCLAKQDILEVDKIVEIYIDHIKQSSLISGNDIVINSTLIQNTASIIKTHILKSFRERVYVPILRTQNKKQKNQDYENDIVVDTIHSQKGLEYDNVFVPILDNIPVNLLYTALTRAKKNLYIPSIHHNNITILKNHGKQLDAKNFLRDNSISILLNEELDNDNVKRFRGEI